MLKLFTKTNTHKFYRIYHLKNKLTFHELLYPLQIKEFFSNPISIEKKYHLYGQLYIKTPQGYSPIHSIIKLFLYMPDGDGKDFDIDKSCFLCKSHLHLEKDYLLPIENGGTNTIENKTTLCISCKRNQKINPFAILHQTKNINYISKRNHSDCLYDHHHFQKIDTNSLQKNVNKFIFHHISSDEVILRENIRIYSKKYGIPIDATQMTLILHDLYSKE